MGVEYNEHFSTQQYRYITVLLLEPSEPCGDLRQNIRWGDILYRTHAYMVQRASWCHGRSRGRTSSTISMSDLTLCRVYTHLLGVYLMQRPPVNTEMTNKNRNK